ncbi:MAG: ANTAR domain-containing response regulator [Armatimonadota bacterium]
MSYRVIIVEDEFLLANNLKALVENLRHEVVGIAETGTEAITLATECAPELILMDIKIPGIDGITAAREILHHRQVPIIIISAFSDHAYVEDAVDAGVMTFLIKPVSLGDLQAAIDLTMARFSELQDLRQEVVSLKDALAQRKVVERAKGILMDQCKLTEGEAYKRLQQQSQRENRSLADIARAVITTYTMWDARGGDTSSPSKPQG